NVSNYVSGKQMRPVLFLHTQRLADFPQTPTSKELGYDITLPQRRAAIVKAGTQPGRVELLSQALVRAVSTDRYKTFLQEANASADSFVQGEEAFALMRRDLNDMRAIVQSTKP